MSQTRGTIQTITRSTPDVATLILAISAFAYVAIVVPRGGRATGSTSRTDLASHTGSTGWTDARITRDTIHTSGPACTWIARAFVDIDTAVWTSETGRAFASKPINTIYTFTTIQTRHRLAIIYVASTVRPFKTIAADAAVIAVDRVYTSTAIRAGITRAR